MDGKTSITWTASQEYLQDFAAYFKTAQKLFVLCRKDRGLLIDLFDHMHEVYRMEVPYFDKDSGMEERHDELRKKVDAFVSAPDSYKKNNFGRLYYEIDAFFTELTTVAVQKNFFPKASKSRTPEEIANHALRQH